MSNLIRYYFMCIVISTSNELNLSFFCMISELILITTFAYTCM